MAITVKFYSFSKKENSTAIPTGGTSFDCTIKDSSSIFFPIIKLNRGAATSAAPAFNYCYISDFGRYYWITNWSWELGIWEASLKCDVLASYKSTIGSASLYALRASNNSDGAIVDNLYPIKSGCSFVDTNITNPFVTMGSGFYVVGVASTAADFGSICYYAFTPANLSTFITNVLSDNLLTAEGFLTADASLALQKSIIDPIQYIKSCVYIPLDITSYPSSWYSVTSVKFYDWDINISAKKISRLSPYTFQTIEVSLPKHPQYSSRGKFTTLAPYSKYQLTAAPFGVIQLDSTALTDASKIYVYIEIDLPTGLGVLKITNDDEFTIARIEAQVGVPVQLSQIMPDYLGAASNIGNTFGNLASGNIGGALGSIGNAAMSLIPSVNTIGSGGSYVQLQDIWQLEAQFFTIVNDDNAHNGRPLCQMVTPSLLSGYMLIQDGDVAISGTQEESQEVKRYLETGFYYE